MDDEWGRTPPSSGGSLRQHSDGFLGAASRPGSSLSFSSAGSFNVAAGTRSLRDKLLSPDRVMRLWVSCARCGRMPWIAQCEGSSCRAALVHACSAAMLELLHVVADALMCPCALYDA